MKSSVLAMAGISVVLAGSGLWLQLQTAGFRVEVDNLQASQQRWNKDNKDQFDQVDKTIAALRQQLQDAQDQLAQARATKPVAAPDAVGSNPASTAAVPSPTIRKTSPELLRQIATASVNNAGGAFISALKLAPEVEAAFRQRLVDADLKISEALQKAGTADVSARQAIFKAFREETDQILADYLTTDQIAAYREYQAQAPARQMEKTRNNYSQTLETQVPGLTGQSRALAASAYVEVNNIPHDRAGSNWQADINDEIAEKLQGKMDEDQLKILKDYYRYQRRMIDALNAGRATNPKP